MQAQEVIFSRKTGKVNHSKVTFNGPVHYIFASFFVSVKESTCEKRKNVISLQKLFSFLR